MGLICGQASKTIGLDLDVKPWKNLDGVKDLERWEAKHGVKLPPTRVHSSPSGGKHLLYRIPQDRKVAGGKHMGPGIDLQADDSRGGGMHLVLPPSELIGNVGANGAPQVPGRYGVLEDAPIADLPPEVLAHLPEAKTRAEREQEKGKKWKRLGPMGSEPLPWVSAAKPGNVPDPSYEARVAFQREQFRTHELYLRNEGVKGFSGGFRYMYLLQRLGAGLLLPREVTLANFEELYNARLPVEHQWLAGDEDALRGYFDRAEALEVASLDVRANETWKLYGPWADLGLRAEPEDGEWMPEKEEASPSVETSATASSAPLPVTDVPAFAPATVDPLGEQVFDWDQVDPPIDWVIDDIIQAATVNMLFGKPNSRKSWLAWLMAAEVSRGGSWLGKAARKGAVVVLDYEGSARTSRRRMRVLKKSGLTGIRYFNPALPLDDPKLWAHMARLAPALIVIDSLSRGMLLSTKVKDQSSDVAMSRPLDMASTLARKTGTSSVFIHHGNKGESKGQDSARGSNAIFGAAEGVFEVTREDEPGRSTLSCTRQKEGTEFPDVVVELSDENGLRLVVPETPVAKGGRTFEEVKRALRLQVDAHLDGAGLDELCRKAGVKDVKQLGRRAMKELVDSASVVRRRNKAGALYLPAIRVDAAAQRRKVLQAVAVGVHGTADLCRAAGVDEAFLMAVATAGFLYKSGQSWIMTTAGTAHLAA